MPMAKQAQNSKDDIIDILMPDKLSQVAKGKSISKPRRCLMSKVPPLLRQREYQQDYYAPQMVSLGPYHHGKKELQLAEDFKLKALEMFVADSGKDVVFFYTKVLEMVNYDTNCYIEEYTKGYDEATFAQMMLLDACFIINIIFRTNIGRMEITANYLGNFFMTFVCYDLFLLENQIPFWILNNLMSLRYGEDEAKKTLDEFLNSIAIGFGVSKQQSRIADADEEQPIHLLDALWQILVSESSGTKPKLSPITGSGCSRIRKCIIAKSQRLLCRRKEDKEYRILGIVKTFVQPFRSVTALKAKGIRFRPRSANSLKDIKFKPGYLFAKLEVPYLFVSRYQTILLSNIIAYEYCSNNKQVVSSYIEFMKCLIDNPEDVKELREMQILIADFDSDENIAKLFNEIRTFTWRIDTTFQDVKEKIQAHCDNKAKNMAS